MNLDRIIAVRNNKTVYRDGERCLKVFGEEFTKADVLNEALNHARVEQTGLNVPRILEVTMLEGKWAIVTEYIKGKTLDALMRDDPANKDRYLEAFVSLQLEMHRQSCPTLNKLKDKMKHNINQTELSATTKYDLQTRLAAMPEHNKLCHGDFNPTNIIIAQDGSRYILDWSHATRGNASADAARTYLLFWFNGDIAGANKYLSLFCEKSDTAKQYVQKWTPLVAASQLARGNAAEREFLRSWINVVDYK